MSCSLTLAFVIFDAGCHWCHFPPAGWLRCESESRRSPDLRIGLGDLLLRSSSPSSYLLVSWCLVNSSFCLSEIKLWNVRLYEAIDWPLLQALRARSGAQFRKFLASFLFQNGRKHSKLGDFDFRPQFLDDSSGWKTLLEPYLWTAAAQRGSAWCPPSTSSVTRRLCFGFMEGFPNLPDIRTTKPHLPEDHLEGQNQIPDVDIFVTAQGTSVAWNCFAHLCTLIVLESCRKVVPARPVQKNQRMHRRCYQRMNWQEPKALGGCASHAVDMLFTCHLQPLFTCYFGTLFESQFLQERCQSCLGSSTLWWTRCCGNTAKKWLDWKSEAPLVRYLYTWSYRCH